MGEAWRVPLPPGAQEPLEVFINGVPQRRGTLNNYFHLLSGGQALLPVHDLFEGIDTSWSR